MCKHFNLSYVEVRDQLHLYEYWQLLAVAAEAEEREDYNFASLVAIGVNDPKRIKKLKPDTTGVGRDPQSFLANMVQAFGGQPTGSAYEYARATGRRIVYVTPVGFVDEFGQATVRDKNDVVLQVQPHGLPN